MTTIFISTGPNHPEDNIIDLAELLIKQFGKDHLTFGSAVVINSDLPFVIDLFQAMTDDPPEPEPKPVTKSVAKSTSSTAPPVKGTGRNYRAHCPECGRGLQKALDDQLCYKCKLKHISNDKSYKHWQGPPSKLTTILDSPDTTMPYSFPTH